MTYPRQSRNDAKVIPGKAEFDAGSQLRIRGKYKEALPLLEKAAQASYPLAYSALYSMYSVGGCLGPRNIEKEGYYKQKIIDSITWLKEQAALGHAEAQHCIGCFYSNGLCLEKNEEQAVYWIQKAAMQEHPIAQCNLGSHYQEGVGVEKEEHEAFSWYQRSALHGYINARLKVADCYRDGIGIAKNIYRAKIEYRTAARLGCFVSEYRLSQCYYYGEGVTQDLFEAAKWAACCAEKGLAEGQWFLGWLYREGLGVPQSKLEMACWYKKAAEQEDQKAEEYLGGCYLYGIGLTVNRSLAVEWYLKSLLHGNETVREKVEHLIGPAETESRLQILTQHQHMSGEQFFTKGKKYFDAEGVEQNFPQAVNYFQESVKRGHVDAIVHLGLCYEKGLGVLKDYQKAIDYYQLVIPDNHPEAQFRLGRCYECGHGVTVDMQEAAKWFLLAANQNEAKAKKMLARLSLEKIAIGVDKKILFTWSLHFAKQNCAESQHYAAHCYRHGWGVSVDSREALEWYQKSADNGYEKAITDLQEYKRAEKRKDDLEYKKQLEAKNKNRSTLRAKQKQLTKARNHEESREFFSPRNTERHSWSEAFRLRREFYAVKREAKRSGRSAKFEVAELYRTGVGVRANVDKAVKYYRRAAEHGHVKASYYMGVYYQFHSWNKKESIKWYQRAANKNDLNAKLRLGLVSKDETSKAWLTQVAEAEDARAQYELGLLYEQDESSTENIEIALRWYQKSAAQCYLPAENKMGYCYEHGIGVEKNLERAYDFYSNLEATNSPEAKYFLGFCYETGFKKEKNVAKAVQFYKHAAKADRRSWSREKGYSPAEYRLGLCYRDGVGVAKDLAESKKWLVRAAVQGHVEAQYEDKWYTQAAEQGHRGAQEKVFELYQAGQTMNPDLVFKCCEYLVTRGNLAAKLHVANCYAVGTSVEQDLSRAFEFYQELYTDKMLAAYSKLAECYELGQGVAKNCNTAIQLYREAAESGCVDSQLKLTMMYLSFSQEDSIEDIVHKWCVKNESHDKEKPITMYRIAEKNNLIDCFILRWCDGLVYQGDDSVRAMRAELHRKEISNQPIYAYAYYWCTELANQGYKIAQNKLAKMYLSKEIQNKTDVKLQWCKNLADAGDVEAQYYIAECYSDGNGVVRDSALARQYYLKAAQEGHAAAQCKVANYYDVGDGCKKCYPTAYKWYSMAAKQNHVESLYKLGCYYLYGKGVRYDHPLAKQYLEQAKGHGHERAGCELWNLSTVSSRMRQAASGDAKMQRIVGSYYEEGKYVLKSLATAFSWYQRSAQQNHPGGLYHLARCYQHGLGVSKNYQEAKKYYRLALGRGFRRDYVEAEEQEINKQLLKKYGFKGKVDAVFVEALERVDSSNGVAEYEIACHLLQGNVVERDETTAITWLKKAIKQKHVEAMYKLGNCYQSGVGGAIKYQAAINFYKQAYWHGKYSAQAKINECEQLLVEQKRIEQRKRERQAREKQERERMEKEQQEREQRIREENARYERERLERIRIARQEREREEREQQEYERQERERQAREEQERKRKEKEERDRALYEEREKDRYWEEARWDAYEDRCRAYGVDPSIYEFEQDEHFRRLYYPGGRHTW